jgi:hypothetical protein
MGAIINLLSKVIMACCESVLNNFSLRTKIWPHQWVTRLRGFPGKVCGMED